MDSAVTDFYKHTIFHWNVWGKLYWYKHRNSWMCFDEATKKRRQFHRTVWYKKEFVWGSYSAL